MPASLAEYEGDRQFATTLARGFELLRCFTPQSPVLGNKALSVRMRLPASTVSRLTYTLMCMGYLAQDGSHGKYRLGSAVISLGYPLLELFTLRQKARPGMLALANEVGGSVAIGIRDRLGVVCIEAIRSQRRSVNHLDVGTVNSLPGTAMGRAYLMACTPDDREALLNQIRVKMPQEWARYEEKLRLNIARYPRWGCCVSVGEVLPDVQGVAVPLGRIDRGELASINCSFQGRALSERWLREVVAPKLLTLARELA